MVTSWGVGDCFEFEFEEVSDYGDDQYGIDYSPVREDINCDDLDVAAACEYVNGNKFRMTM